MRALGTVMVAAALAACGAEEAVAENPASVRMLTIFAPQYGSIVGPKVTVEVAETGAAPGRPYDIGLLVDGELVVVSPTPAIEVELAEGVRELEVIGVDGEGRRLLEVIGDDIWLRVTGD